MQAVPRAEAPGVLVPGLALPDDLANPQANLAPQHLEPILRRPDKLKAEGCLLIKDSKLSGNLPPQTELRRWFITI